MESGYRGSLQEYMIPTVKSKVDIFRKFFIEINLISLSVELARL